MVPATALPKIRKPMFQATAQNNEPISKIEIAMRYIILVSAIVKNWEYVNINPAC
jgi:hypothetical protein